MNFQQELRNAGVVGAGGAGFPAHVKASARVDVVIANGAECEPLLHKDLELCAAEPEAVVAGLKALRDATGARRAIFGVKRKHEDRLGPLFEALKREEITVHLLGDFYPTGDEYVLVYESTKRLIPPQGIPLDVGVVVNNVETLRNMALASRGIPVTQKYVTVAGAVKHPCTLRVPVGIAFADLVDAAGGATTGAYAAFVGGIMMGSLTTDMSLPVTKTCAGIVVLPLDHRLVQRKSLTVQAMDRIGKSACDQCSYCTEFCPRYLLGYDVQPHKVMRSLSFTATGEAIWNQWAQLCCSCGLCTLYACPEDLYPKEACDRAKADLKVRGMAWIGNRDLQVHPMAEGRHVPLKQLMGKLGVAAYDVPAPFRDEAVKPVRVRLPLRQHIGEAAKPVVAVGAHVKAGDLVGDVPAGVLGARVHASIDGTVKKVDGDIVIEHQWRTTR
jgi:Na+-translocating ferredoxin:NAD+ oxidoreductase RnfC subunit